MEKYFCTTCNKKYASYKSLWNHNKKFHRANKNNNNNINCNNNNINCNNNNISKIIEKSSIPKLQCGYCNDIFRHASNKSIHIISCKLKHPEIQIINNRNICRYCDITFNCIMTTYRHEKICKQKQISIINNNNNNNNNITNTVNNNNTIYNINSNNTINNNIFNNKYIVNFSDNGDFFRLLSRDQKVQIIEQCRLSFTKMISLTNFNDDYPELQNIYFVNLKDDIGYVFEDSRFIAINKSEVLNETYNNKIDLIYEILNDTSIDNKFKKNFEKFYSQLQDTNLKYQHQDKKYDNLKDFIMEQMNFIIYNNSNKKLFEKLKKSETLKKISINEFFNNLENKRNDYCNNKIK